MKTLRSISLAAAALLPLALCATAQVTGKPDKPPKEEGGGGGYGGPGDTAPNGPSGSGTGDDTGPKGPAPAGPQPTGPQPTPYADGVNPFGTRGGPAGADQPGSGNDTPAPITPASRPRLESPNSWKLWWHYNRWAFLDDVPSLANSGGGGFYIGRGEKAQVSPLLRASRAQMQDIVQPALLQALATGGRPELEIYALQALAKLRSVVPDPELGGFADIVHRFLKSGNQEVAEKAILSLGVRGEVRFVPWLVSILEDSPEGRSLIGRQRVGLRFRAFAAYGLGLIGERTSSAETRVAIYDALVQALWLDRVEVQAACLTALGLTPMPIADEYVGQGELFAGKTRVDQVLELISFFDDAEQSYVARSQAPSALARLLVDAPDSLRGRAIYTLLVASGQHSKELREVQNAAVMALGSLGRSGGDPIDDQVLAHLERIAYKSSADRSTRFLAMTALAEVASRRGMGDEPFGAVEPTRKLFTQNLARSRGETQAWTALGLGILERNAPDRGELPAPSSGQALRKVFEKTRSSEVAGAIAIALGMLRDLESEQMLRERMIDSGEEFVRGYTALALGMIGSPASVTDLQRVLKESTMKPFVIENAAIALALLGDQGIGSWLFEILDGSSSPKIQASVASAVGWIKDPRPVAELCSRLLDPRKNETGRAWTAVAIGRICDEDPWPWNSRVSAGSQYDVWLPTLVEPQLQNGLLDLP